MQSGASLDRLPPHTVEGEQAVLSCILQDPTKLDDALDAFGENGNVFYDLKHQTIYHEMKEMSVAGKEIDVATLCVHLSGKKILDQCGGIQYLSQLVDASHSPSTMPTHVGELTEKWIRRKTIAACTNAVSECYDSGDAAHAIVARTEQTVAGILDGNQTALIHGKDLAELVVSDLEYRFERRGTMSGIGSGFYDLDAKTDGFQRGELALIGARPSIGKTAMGLTIVSHVVFDLHKPALIVTAEMRPAALMRRIISIMTDVPLADLRSGRLTDEDMAKVASFTAKQRDSGLYIYNAVGGVDIARVQSAISRMKRQHGVEFVMLDYLQIIRPTQKHEKRTYEVAQVSNGLKAAAERNNVAVMSLAQVNREPDKDRTARKPRMSDLADSGQIERDADLIILIHRDIAGEKPCETLVSVEKQRDGETGSFRLNFMPKWAKFENMAPSSYDDA